MHMYLTAVSSAERIQIPLLPNRVDVKAGASVVSSTIINLGEVRIPRGSELTGYSWTGIFPGEHMKNFSFVSGWESPASIIATLENWMNNGTTLTLLVTDLTINRDVFIESFAYEYAGGVGDVSYTINLTVRRKLTISVVSPAVGLPTEAATTDSGSGSSTQSTSKKKKYGKVKTNGSNLNIRKTASTNAAIIGKLANGKKTELLAKKGNWYTIPYSKGSGGKAYVYASYIKVVTS